MKAKPRTKQKPKPRPSKRAPDVDDETTEAPDAKPKRVTVNKAVENFMRKGAKMLGEKAIVKLSDNLSRIRFHYNTFLTPLNIALTGKRDGGIPSGRVTAIYGHEQVGKTTLGLMLMQSMQQDGGAVFLVDSENTLQSNRAEEIGVATDEVVVIDEEYLEPCLDATKLAIESMMDNKAMLFYDTIAGTPSVHDRGRSLRDAAKTAAHAQALARFFRGISRPIGRSNFALVLCNQMKTGAIGNSYANEREMNAMLALKPIKFHADVVMRVEYMRKFFMLQNGEKVQRGFEVKVTVEKNKNLTENVAIRLVLSSYNNGRFDDALSCLATMRMWKLLPKTDAAATFSYYGQTYTIKKWRKDFETNQELRDMVASDLEEEFLARYNVGN